MKLAVPTAGRASVTTTRFSAAFNAAKADAVASDRTNADDPNTDSKSRTPLEEGVMNLYHNVSQFEMIASAFDLARHRFPIHGESAFPKSLPAEEDHAMARRLEPAEIRDCQTALRTCWLSIIASQFESRINTIWKCAFADVFMGSSIGGKMHFDVLPADDDLDPQEHPGPTASDFVHWQNDTDADVGDDHAPVGTAVASANAGCACFARLTAPADYTTGDQNIENLPVAAQHIVVNVAGDQAATQEPAAASMPSPEVVEEKASMIIVDADLEELIKDLRRWARKHSEIIHALADFFQEAFGRRCKVVGSVRCV